MSISYKHKGRAEQNRAVLAAENWNILSFAGPGSTN